MKTNNTSQVKKHKDRSDLIGEHRWGDAGQLILLVIFLIIWIADSFILHYSTFLTDYVSVYIRILCGTLVLFLSWQLARAGLRIVFGEVRDKPEVIKKGVFSWVRHPIYLGSILLYLGLILYSMSLLAIGCWLIIILFYYLISMYEEKILTDYFGQEYIRYKREVPMLFPKVTKKLSQS